MGDGRQRRRQEEEEEEEEEEEGGMVNVKEGKKFIVFVREGFILTVLVHQ